MQPLGEVFKKDNEILRLQKHSLEGIYTDMLFLMATKVVVG